MANTLAHNATELITSVKSFGNVAFGLYHKSFTNVIYDCNDNGMTYKTMIIANLTMIVANLALARSVNYDRKVRCKLKHTFTIVNYNPKPFIVQSTEIFLSQNIGHPFSRLNSKEIEN